MSASREKKNRQAQNQSGYVDPKQKRAQEQAAIDRRDNIIYSVVAIAFVVIAAVLLYLNSGIPQRSANAVRVDGVTYKATDVAYYYRTNYSQFVSENSNSLSALGLDTSADLREQVYPLGSDYATWHEFFMSRALDTIASDTKLVQLAEAEGFDAAEDVETGEQNALNSLDIYASVYGYTSRTQYLKAVFGSYMTEKDYLRNVRRAVLASKYAETHSETLAPTDAEIDAAYAADPNAYDNADIEYILFPAQIASDASDSDRQRALEETEKRATGVLSLQATGESLEKIANDLGATYIHLAHSTYSDSDLAKWAFDAERKDGDTAVIPYNGDRGHLAVLFHSHTKKEYHTVTVRDVTVSDEQTAKDVLEYFLSGDTTETRFSILDSVYGVDLNDTSDAETSNGLTASLYTDLDFGDMPEAFENWAYDPARKSGDTGIVETEYGFHVMYFVGTNDLPRWQAEIRTKLQDDAISAWRNELIENANIERLGGLKYVH